MDVTGITATDGAVHRLHTVEVHRESRYFCMDSTAKPALKTTDHLTIKTNL